MLRVPECVIDASRIICQPDWAREYRPHNSPIPKCWWPVRTSRADPDANQFSKQSDGIISPGCPAPRCRIGDCPATAIR